MQPDKIETKHFRVKRKTPKVKHKKTDSWHEKLSMEEG